MKTLYLILPMINFVFALLGQLVFFLSRFLSILSDAKKRRKESKYRTCINQIDSEIIVFVQLKVIVFSLSACHPLIISPN